MKTKAMKVGIMPYKKYKKYTMAIACGQYKPKRNEPKIWFESIETFCQVLSTRNLELLNIINEKKPRSLRELAEISGRQVSNLSRTLKTFNKYGIVDLIESKRAKVPVARTTSFNVEYGKNYPSFLFDDV
ncbi:MAG: transcriptional regulator [Desulfobacterales bacterium]